MVSTETAKWALRAMYWANAWRMRQVFDSYSLEYCRLSEGECTCLLLTSNHCWIGCGKVCLGYVLLHTGFDSEHSCIPPCIHDMNINVCSTLKTSSSFAFINGHHHYDTSLQFHLLHW